MQKGEPEKIPRSPDRDTLASSITNPVARKLSLFALHGCFDCATIVRDSATEPYALPLWHSLDGVNFMKQSEYTNEKKNETTEPSVSLIDHRERVAMDLIHASLGSGPWNMEFDESGKMISCSWTDTFRHMLGYKSVEDFPNVLESWSDLLHDEDKPHVMQEYWDTVQDYTGVKTYDVEYRLLTRNNGWRWFHAAGRLARREDGSPIAFYGLFVDIDEKKRMSEQLQRQTAELQEALAAAQYANRAKTTFLNNISHDIRTPMNAIIGFTNLALESNDTETQREYLNNIAVSSKYLLALINDILELSKIENQKVELNEKLVNMNETYQKLESMFRIDLEKKNLSCTISLDIRHIHLYMDITHYSQIFLNIVSNAIKYTPTDGRITISCKEFPGDTLDTCVLETVIQDNGIGMSSEFLSHAYESFSRERTSTISGIQGTGLGLAIVKNFVELMQGTIHIESQPDHGTKVTIRTPHRLGNLSEEAKAEEPAEIDYSILADKRFLLAEDIDINAIIATKLLTDRGCIVERAKDGVECVDMMLKADAGYYDLILMDIQMPNMNGYAAAQSIRAFKDTKKAAIPILAMTANAFQEDFDKTIESGMNGHIAKPLDTEKMFRTITGALRKRQQLN